MKTIILVLAAMSLGLCSCKKHKEQKAWENKFGTYYAAGSNQYELYVDSANQIKIDIASIQISEEAIAMNPVLPQQPVVNFKRSAVNNNTNYEYQIWYTSFIMYGIVTYEGGAELINIPFPTEPEFSQGRTFFITENNGALTLAISINGTIQEFYFQKG